MKNIIIIARKEAKDLFRDKRTLLTMIVIPLLIFPILFNVMGKITSKQVEKEMEKPLKIGLIGEKNAPTLVQLLEKRSDVTITNYSATIETDTLINKGSLDGALLIDDGFDLNVESDKTGTITLFYKSANWGVKDRLMGFLGDYRNSVTQKRLAKLNIDPKVLNPVDIKVQDISTKREKFGKTIGGYLPYLFIIFSFIGCMYPAIDLFTNEKERGTLETILASPVSRLEILFGKMSVVSLIGFLSALLSIVGLMFGLKQFAKALPQDVMGTLSSFIDPGNVTLLLSLLIPLVVFFAGILTLITTYAKSYKEAQSIISPMMFIIILPAVVGLLPGTELNSTTALIPITNISLAAKEIIAGTLNFAHYGLVLGSMIVYAVVVVFLSLKWFNNESNIIKA